MMNIRLIVMKLNLTQKRNPPNGVHSYLIIYQFLSFSI